VFVRLQKGVAGVTKTGQMAAGGQFFRGRREKAFQAIRAAGLAACIRGARGSRHMRRFSILSLVLAGATLVAPVAMRADDHHDRRYYDRDGRDYHTWNDHEDRAYRIYLGEQHRDYRDFGRINAARRRDYFRWRHEHPDNAIFKLEVR
jgi:hypothetical protein